MSPEKTFERAVRAAWDEIRAERRASRRLLSSADIAQSAARLRGIADRLDALAAEASAAEPAPADADAAPKPKTKAKPKPKKTAKSKAAKKSSKK